jgi:hypothetical protein
MKAILSIVIKILLALVVVLSTDTISIQGNVKAAGPWYVSTTGNDSNDCLSSSSPCRNINAAVTKATSGDTIFIATGTYTATDGIPVVTLNKSLTLSGGWDETFITHSGRSVIDGEDSHEGIYVPYVPLGNLVFTLSRFVIQNGWSPGMGGGIDLGEATMTIEDSIIQNNYADAGGGGIHLSYGSLLIRNSVVAGNTSHTSGGGIDDNYANVIIENSTISGNYAESYGGGIVLSGMSGNFRTYNTTISMNGAGIDGGGIWGGYDILLNNTILSGNTAIGRGLDCYLSAESDFTGGYNLIGDSSGCDFIPTTGDLVDVDPQLGALQDNGGDTLTQALSAGSLAVDRGDPAGCKDHLGNPITSDQRGLARENRCDIGAYEWQPPPPAAYQVFLPCISRLCSPFYYDNFSNPGSGWAIFDGSYAKYEYLNNEYRILVKGIYSWAGSRAPLISSDYYIKADVRNASGVNGSYGLIFGLSSDWSQFYDFEIYTDGYYAIYQYQNEDWYTLAWGLSPDIHTGMATNQISIRRSGSQIWAYANGTLLNILEQGDYTGLRYTGLIAFAYDQAPVDVRYDNFEMYSPNCGPATNDLTTLIEMQANPQKPDQHNHSEGTSRRNSEGLQDLYNNK